MTKKIRVVLVDDHELFREGLKRIFIDTANIVLVAEASNFEELEKVRKTVEWDILILDLRMPGKSGLDILTYICEKEPNSKVLMLSMHAERQYAVRALRAGASGYLTKDCHPSILVDAIEKIHNGRKYVSEELGEHLINLVAQDARQEPHDVLSDREFQVFLALARGERPVDIAERLSISAKTIDTHRRRIFDKLEIDSVAELARYAIEAELI